MRDLFFDASGTFTVMQVTDTHFCGDPETDGRTDRLLRRLIAWEKPDFIVHTGDAVYGMDSCQQLAKALAPLTESGIPWTFTFGNHDAEAAQNRSEMLETLIRLPGSCVWQDELATEKSRAGDHVLRILDEEGRPRWLLVCMDSGGDEQNPRIGGGYAAVTGAQIRWYEDRIREAEADGFQGGVLLFQHIALPEHRDVWKYEVTYGMRRENISCPRVNTGLFAALLQSPARGLFVGHDHVNDFYGELFGITLGYGRQSGYGSYSAPDYLRGCRMIRLHAHDPLHFETWLRLENGEEIREPWKREPDVTRTN